MATLKEEIKRLNSEQAELLTSFLNEFDGKPVSVVSVKTRPGTVAVKADDKFYSVLERYVEISVSLANPWDVLEEPDMPTDGEGITLRLLSNTNRGDAAILDSLAVILGGLFPNAALRGV